ncbi:MAG: DUF3426 domain-containing protein [Desulfobulbus sp.]|nr:DUF3426 domain-containing protein [Desulfobulbus sp.]
MMRTRCPVCGTVFRVTSEQLRLKAGKVRCGHCRGVFNAFDQLLTDEPPSETLPPPARKKPAPVAVAPVEQPAPPAPAATIAAQPPAAAAETLPPAAVAASPFAGLPVEEITATEVKWPETAILLAESPEQATPEAPQESPEQTTQAARQAGLAAIREWPEAPAYNRWALGALAGEPPEFVPESEPALWPFVIIALLLALALAVQLLYYFRTEVVRWLPATAAYYELAGIAVPLPRQSELIAKEFSDLQFDKQRDLFVLEATLRNRAHYAQDWPALELTLTDINDKVVARRIIPAGDYLPPTISPERFPANGEVSIRLWIEARNLGAVGYRLDAFYP